MTRLIVRTSCGFAFSLIVAASASAQDGAAATSRIAPRATTPASTAPPAARRCRR